MSLCLLVLLSHGLSQLDTDQGAEQQLDSEGEPSGAVLLVRWAWEHGDADRGAEYGY